MFTHGKHFTVPFFSLLKNGSHPQLKGTFLMHGELHLTWALWANPIGLMSNML
jgi:hypothetical protein